MASQYKVFFICLLVFMPFSATLPTTGAIQKSNKISSYNIPFRLAPLSVKYSTFVNYGSEYVNVYTAYQSGLFLYLSNSTLTTTSGSTSNDFIINTADKISSTSDLLDYNYFISNNNGFLILSSQLSNNYQIKIINLSNNQSFVDTGSTDYHIVSINRFSNSPDPYFSVYNSSEFMLLKYNFQTNNFSIILSKAIAINTNLEISNVRILMFNDKLYISFLAQTTVFGNISATTNLYILNTNGIILNKELQDFALTSFTTIPGGLLLYSLYSSSYYQYSYSQGAISLLSTNLPPGTSLLCPYDNNSFLLLDSNTFKLITRLSTNNFEIDLSYFVQNSEYPNNQNTLQAIFLANDYYLYSGLNNQGKFEIYFSNSFEAPNDFSISAPTTLSVTTSYPQYYTSSYAYTNISANNLVPLALFIIIFLIIIGAIVLNSKKNRSNRYYNPRDRYYSQNYQRNQYYPQQRQQTLHCSNCGSKVELGDIFCQNCGSRL